MRRFQFIRVADETGISGTGVVAEGVVLSSGKVVVNWLTKYATISIYDSFADAEFLHGHDGKTKTVWLDRPDGTWHCYKCGTDVVEAEDTITCTNCKKNRFD